MQTDLIVAGIEDEIDRLRRIRAILAPLLDTTEIPTPKPRQRKAPPVAAEVPVTVTVVPPREPRKRRVRVPKPVEQPSVLKGAIPSAPVVFRPAASKVAERIPESIIAVQPGSFAAMVRAAERELEAVS